MNTLAARYPVLDAQMHRFGFWSAVVALTSGVIAMFLPLDVPNGFAADHADRILWLSANKGAFIAGWVNQIVAMVSLSGVFFAIAWLIGDKNPLRAVLTALVVLLSVVAFIIPKFIAVWTIPALAQAVSSGAAGSELANSLLRLLNVSVPFSLYTSFDYLGFWLYAVFGLLVVVPLFGQTATTKVAAVSLGLFGLGFHALLGAYWMGAVAPADIEGYFLWPSVLLLIAVIAMVFYFKKAGNRP